MGAFEEKTVFCVRIGKCAGSGETVNRASFRIEDQRFPADIDEKRNFFSDKPFRNFSCDMKPCAFPVFAPFLARNDRFVGQFKTFFEFHGVFGCRIFAAEGGTVGINFVFDAFAKNVCPALVKFEFSRKHAENPSFWLEMQSVALIKYNRLQKSQGEVEKKLK